MDDNKAKQDHKKQEYTGNESSNGMNRRDVLKGLASIPVVGAVAWGVLKKERYTRLLKKNVQEAVNLSAESPVMFSSGRKDPKIRIGIIGFGIRGPHLFKAAGFVHPEEIDAWKSSARENSGDKRYDDFMAQDDLNLVCNGVCDLFDVRAEKAMEASANAGREGSDGTFGPKAKRYRHYIDLLNADDIDAVIIATPDHYHAEIVIEAAKRGKHVYVEKAMTRTIEEAYRVRDAVKNSNIVFQLGHQGRQTESYLKAKEAIEKEAIGKVNLIEVCTNRNSANGAWIYNIHPDGNENTIDWQQFQQPCDVKRPFSAERFFRWRCWWDYGTGLSGDLLTHEFDAINQILQTGIPHSALSSGGVYYWKDKSKGHYVHEMRDVPDVWQVAYEFPQREFTLLYSASLASDKDRGKTIMGHDGYMELGRDLSIYADRDSTKYKDKIKSGKINPDLPIFTYIPGRNNVDAVATPTEQYFAGRGLLYTYRNGKRVDTTHLHISEWIGCIRETMATGKVVNPSCNIDRGFEEAITAHMATKSYREDRKVFWDAENERVVL